MQSTRAGEGQSECLVLSRGSKWFGGSETVLVPLLLKARFPVSPSPVQSPTDLTCILGSHVHLEPDVSFNPHEEARVSRENAHPHKENMESSPAATQSLGHSCCVCTSATSVLRHCGRFCSLGNLHAVSALWMRIKCSKTLWKSTSLTLSCDGTQTHEGRAP